ncbi:MAG: Clp protease N-terminal domain-containing protein [Armatimonadota bacterium]
MPDIWQRFTNPATRVIHFAQEEAKRMGMNVVGTEHILVGLLREGEGVAARVLKRLGVSLKNAREVADRHAPVEKKSGGSRLTLSEHGKKALEYALQEARELNPKFNLLDFVDTEHILLGLIRNTHKAPNRASEILQELNVGAALVRQEVLTAISAPPDAVFFDVEQLPLDESNKRRLTEGAKKALQYALMEAANLGKHEMGLEHLLMGLKREGNGVAAHALDQLNIKYLQMREMLGGAEPPEPVEWESVEVGPLVAKALSAAVEELEDFHVKYGAELFLDTEHLLLGLLHVRGEDGFAMTDLLANLGTDPQRIRQEVLSVMGLTAPVSAEERPVAPDRKGVDVWLSLSESAFRVLTLAGEEAHRHGTEVIDVPHLAAGLLRFNEAALARQHVLMDQVRAALFDQPAVRGAAVPSLSPQCADVLGLAYQAALKETPSGALVRITPGQLVQALLEGADVFGYDTVRKLADLGVVLEQFKAEL